MSDFLNFTQILEGKIRKDLASSQNSSQNSSQKSTPPPAESFGGHQQIDTDPAHLAYLLSQLKTVGSASNASSRSAKVYAKPKSQKPAKKPHTLSPRQELALADFFSALSPAFSEKELKVQFWTLAKRLHPDVSQDDGKAFIGLKSAYQELQTLFKK